MEVLNAVTELPEDSILLLRDFHQFFDDPNPVLIRRLKDQVRESRTTGKTLVVLGCRLNLPPELEREFAVIDIALPGSEELNAVLKGITESTEQPMPKTEIVSDLVDAARGMTTTEAENAFALSVVESGELERHPDRPGKGSGREEERTPGNHRRQGDAGGHRRPGLAEGLAPEAEGGILARVPGSTGCRCPRGCSSWGYQAPARV